MAKTKPGGTTGGQAALSATEHAPPSGHATAAGPVGAGTVAWLVALAGA